MTFRKMFLKVKFDAEVQFLNIPDPKSEGFSCNDIIASIVQQLNINTECEIVLRDRDGALIQLEYLEEILLQYKGCSSFLINIYINENWAEEKQIGKKSSINYKDLEIYIKTGDYSCILEEYKNTNNLSDNSRRSLVREAINFLRNHCGNHPKREEKIALAESIINIFPAFKIANSKFGGIDLFYNPANNSGYLASKLKNINSKLTKLGSSKKRKCSEGDHESDDEVELSKEDLHFFQNCIVAAELGLVQRKLRETLKARQNFIITECNVLKHFPIFLYEPSLINFDFNLRYGESISNGFLQNWGKYEMCMEKVWIDSSGTSGFLNNDKWTSEVLPFFILLKLLPSTSYGRDRKRVNFQASVDSFINFENINTPVGEYTVGSNQPTIIAVGQDRSSFFNIS